MRGPQAAARGGAQRRSPARGKWLARPFTLPHHIAMAASPARPRPSAGHANGIAVVQGSVQGARGKAQGGVGAAARSRCAAQKAL